MRLSRGHTPNSEMPSRNNNAFEFDDGQFPLQDQQSYSSHQSGQQQLQPQGNQMYMPITTSSNSCVYATDMITTMVGSSDPSSVRADLGCLPGMDCEVDNHLVFSVMDRYTGSGVGL